MEEEIQEKKEAMEKEIRITGEIRASMKKAGRQEIEGLNTVYGSVTLKDGTPGLLVQNAETDGLKVCDLKTFMIRPELDLKQLVKDMLAAVKALHKLGWAHCDIK